ncbi:uncharacterized protein DC041_0006684 [Schistosoma bovis]|uniref:NADH:ubiquinone oxidoreductase intermediate-associated protein 30 domain-containing protein n=1 Tax=Schistosoma bovis TaxID=6184 RepID=A0A430QUR2_SCHBO|nr:uncharacterized protein DC041_0006684 [Schistosoma bovis]
MTIRNISVIVTIFTTLLLNTCKALKENSLKITITRRGDLANVTLFNFTDSNTTAFENWTEISDATLIGGRSKTALVRLEGQNYQSAIFFYLLTPPPNGSSFAGVPRIVADGVLPAYDGVLIDLHKQGPHSHFELFVYEKGSNIQYETIFETSGKRQQIKLPFGSFTSCCCETPHHVSTLSDVSKISRIGIKAHELTNQSGPGAVEIFPILTYKKNQMPV